ncbi:competence protein [Fulvivirga imtechensis AK7]|uniref:Competence protein n=1 Tax=Fulvivirga imtechensis AK7 TaxID=1237149 RepID=L8JYQ0_9BACT|nr:competence protein [Fulvivirga imtechensis AK7]
MSGLGFVTLFALGYFHLTLSTEANDLNHILHQKGISHYVAVVTRPGEQRTKTARYQAEILSYRANDQWSEGLGKIYLYLNKGSDLKYGDKILVKGAPQLLTPPQNPEEFDYKRFLSFKNIYHQQFLDSAAYQLIKHDPPNKLLSYAFVARKWATHQLSARISSPRELNIALALVLGVKDGLDNEIQHAYAASGAMHVLAVSGLHVGIVYGMIALLMGRIKRSKSGRWAFALISILVLWSYALITGFSPSVLRAVTMFSFIAVADAANRDTNIYNTLAASAFALLLFDPYLIMSVGFQLSFLAVLGIVYIQPRLYGLYVPNNWLVDKIWAITAVAFAAQLATFPLGLLYFHQFPTFFFLSNLVVIPGAFVILCLGLLVIIFSWIGVLAGWLGKLLEWCIYLVNEVVFWIERIPFSQVTGVHTSVLETWLILLIIIMLFIFFRVKHMRFVYIAFLLVLCFSSFRIASQHLAQQDKISIYRISHHTAIDFMADGHAFFYGDSVLLEDSGKIRFHIMPNRLSSNIRESTPVRPGEVSFINTFNGVTMASWRGTKLIILNNEVQDQLFTAPVTVDYILICREFNKDLEWIKNNFIFDLLILDGTLSYYQANKFKKEIEADGLKYYSIYHEGALEITY